MQTFTERFKALPVDQKQQLSLDERRTRVKADVDKYVCIPIAVPKMSQMSRTPVDFQLGWAIAVPGEQVDDDGNPARAALTVGFPDETTAEDFCWMMNNAHEQRKMNASG
jgi:hypothetical protein